MRVVKVTSESCNVVIGDHVEVAETSLRRMKGLLGREGLSAGAGLWIKPSSGVHTVGMKFAIDVIGLDGDRRVVKLWQNLAPHRVTSVSAKLRSVVELSAGRIAECGVGLGDLLRIE